MKIYILDGYNVIHGVPAFEKYLNASLEAARKALIDFCIHQIAIKKDIEKIFIIFDGKDEFQDLNEGRQGKIEIVFSRTGETADERIIEILQDLPRNPQAYVVSADNYVFNHSKAMIANVLKPKKFYEDFAKPAPSRNQREEPSEEDRRRITEEYKKFFNL